MAAIRFLAIAVLVYLAYRVLKSFNRGKNLRSQQKTPPLTDDILREDPVCKKLVPQHQAVVYETDGRRVYFCSQQCCRAYQKKQGEQS